MGPPPPMPQNTIKLARQNSVQRAKDCDAIWDSYKEAIEQCQNGAFSVHEGVFDSHHYKSKATEAGPAVMKAVMKEVRKDLPKSLELSSSASMFVRVDEDRPQFLRALLTGVSGSAYDSGLFCFDIYCPDSYPNTNCLVTHTSKHATMVKGNNGPGGFSPNLHQSSGKVCLSLLGTWDGPGWQSGVSNVYQVLASIQFLILGVSHPYYNEPGQGFWEGSAPKTDHSEKVIEYTERVWFGTARYAILEAHKNPPEGFEEVADAHFRAKWRLILKLVESWWEKGTAGLKEKLSPVLAELRQRFTETYLTVEEAKRDVEAAQITIRFIEEKMRYLEVKVNLAGGGRLAKKRVPKAYRRLRLGPNLLAMARKELREKQNALAAVEERNHADASR